ncbi:hypothetical protein [Dyadobacter psychrotolerans]|uniref:DUF3575 domain-containing protein n=1 Tax=Dyadobacter psychrotolerans TaxID=2541721 RepID=A0A4V2Z3C2_9BACT|nr:hypothetical protein [Dyadobacter psychrotolerans]TDE12138.1 hypothetical protein E0F88_24140 [Dyadobacter psychrotolerans]
MKVKFCLSILLITTLSRSYLIAQGTEGQLTKNQLRIDFLFPGIAFERAVSKDMSFVLDSHVGLTSADNNELVRKNVAMQTISLQYRYYLNLQKRFSKGRSTLTNSGLYTGIITEQAIFYGQKESTLFSKAGIISGFQQTFHNGFNINVAGGAGYTDGINFKAKIRPIIQLSLGIVLGAKKKYRQKE